MRKNDSLKNEETIDKLKSLLNTNIKDECTIMLTYKNENPSEYTMK